jgi:hypothetical protein
VNRPLGTMRGRKGKESGKTGNREREEGGGRMRGRTAASKRPGSLEVSMIAHRSVHCPDNRPVIVPVQSLHSWLVVPCQMGARRTKSAIVRGIVAGGTCAAATISAKAGSGTALVRHTTGPQSLLSSLGTRRHQAGHPPWLPSIPGDDHAGSRTSHPKTAPVVYPSAAYQQHRPGACAALIAVISLAASPATAITPPTCLLPTPARHHGRPRPDRA